MQLDSLHSNIQGAIFDMDGTLLDSIGTWRGLDAMLAHEAGVLITVEEHKEIEKMTIFEAAQHFHVKHGFGKSTEAVVHVIDEYMRDYYENRATLLPGVAEFLEACAQAGVKMGVASSSASDLLDAGLRRAGVRDYFSLVLSVDDVKTSKREPLIFDVTREKLATPKGATWVFEDSLYAIATLTRAQYNTVGIFGEYQHCSFREFAKHVDIAVRDFTDLTVTKQGELRYFTRSFD